MGSDRSFATSELSSLEESPPRPHWWWRRSLRVKIIAWFFVPTALLLIAVGVTNFFAYQDVTADLVIERNQDLTLLSASQLSTSFVEFTEKPNTFPLRLISIVWKSGLYVTLPTKLEG